MYNSFLPKQCSLLKTAGVALSIKSVASRSIHSTSAISFAGSQIVDAQRASTLEKKKAIKDAAPKRPGSAYMIYAQSIRRQLMDQNPDNKVTQIAKLCGEHWRNLSENEKEPFKEQYQKKMEEFKLLKQEFNKTLPPKRPAGPFLLFIKDVRQSFKERYPELSTIEITKKMSEQWSSMSFEEQNHYVSTYKRELGEWKSKMSEHDSPL